MVKLSSWMSTVMLFTMVYDVPLLPPEIAAYLATIVELGGSFLGVAHLVPWVPLLLYMVLRLTSDIAGPPVSLAVIPVFAWYLYLLLACLVVCLSLDAWDVIRYVRGERYVLGSPDAVWAGASRPSPERLPWKPQHSSGAQRRC